MRRTYLHQLPFISIPETEACFNGDVSSPAASTGSCRQDDITAEPDSCYREQGRTHEGAKRSQKAENLWHVPNLPHWPLITYKQHVGYACHVGARHKQMRPGLRNGGEGGLCGSCTRRCYKARPAPNSRETYSSKCLLTQHASIPTSIPTSIQPHQASQSAPSTGSNKRSKRKFEQPLSTHSLSKPRGMKPELAFQRAVRLASP